MGNSSLSSTLTSGGLAYMNRVANPLMRLVLGSRLHGALAPWIMELEYVGRRSGRTISLPVMYAVADDGIIVVVPTAADAKTWWRNFEDEPIAVTLTIEGERKVGHAVVGRDPARIKGLVDAYTRRFPLATHAMGEHPLIVEIVVEAAAEGSADAEAADTLDLTEEPPKPWVSDPAHAPGHRHRAPAASQSGRSVGPGQSTRNQPWVRTTHSDSRQRRFRGGR